MAKAKKKKIPYIDVKDSEIAPYSVEYLVKDYATETGQDHFSIGVDFGLLECGKLNSKEMGQLLSLIVMATTNYVLKTPERFERTMETKEDIRTKMEVKPEKAVVAAPKKKRKRQDYMG